MGEKEFEQIYGEYLDNLEETTENVKNAYQEMHDAFDKYLCAVEEWIFQTAFEFGQNYATKSEMRKVV